MNGPYVSDHLTLEVIEESDNLFMFELLNSDGWIKFIGDRNVSSAGQATEYIRRLMASPSIEYYVVRKKNDDQPVGIISFVKREYLDAHDLGFAFLPQFAGKGMAFEAAETVLRAKVSEGHPMILATTLPHNERSIGLLMKLGFSFSHSGNNGQDAIHIYRITRDQVLSMKNK